MSYPTKVVIEITADSYSSTVLSGETIIGQIEMIMESRGCAKSKGSTSLLDDNPFYSELAEAIEDADFRAFDIAKVLIDIREDFS